MLLNFVNRVIIKYVIEADRDTITVIPADCRVRMVRFHIAARCKAIQNLIDFGFVQLLAYD